MALLRRLMGDALRSRRQVQQRTLRDVSAAARVSLGYLSEVERGQKEASSELLASICDALDVPLSDLLREVSDELARSEPGRERRVGADTGARGPQLEPVPDLPVRRPAVVPAPLPAGTVVNRAA